MFGRDDFRRFLSGCVIVAMVFFAGFARSAYAGGEAMESQGFFGRLFSSIGRIVKGDDVDTCGGVGQPCLGEINGDEESDLSPCDKESGCIDGEGFAIGDDDGEAASSDGAKLKKKDGRGKFGGLLYFFLGVFGLNGAVIDDVHLEDEEFDDSEIAIEPESDGDFYEGGDVLDGYDFTDDIDVWDEEERETPKFDEDEVVKALMGEDTSLSTLDIEEALSTNPDENVFLNDKGCGVPDSYSAKFPLVSEIIDSGHVRVESSYNDTNGYCWFNSEKEFRKAAEDEADIWDGTIGENGEACPDVVVEELNYTDVRTPDCYFILHFKKTGRD